MASITVNLSRMFARYEPWDCSNSVANLGPLAGKLTWECSLEVARSVSHWLCRAADHDTLVRAQAQWMADCGWEDDAVDDMDSTEIIATFVQNLAGSLRDLSDVDDTGVEDFNWNDETETHPIYSIADSLGERLADVYVGS